MHQPFWDNFLPKIFFYHLLVIYLVPLLKEYCLISRHPTRICPLVLLSMESYIMDKRMLRGYVLELFVAYNYQMLETLQLKCSLQLRSNVYLDFPWALIYQNQYIFQEFLLGVSDHTYKSIL